MLPAYLLMCLIYGTTFLAIKVGLGAGFPPFLFAGIRFVVAALVILGFFVVRGQRLPRTRAELVPLLLIGVGNTLIPFGCLYTAERVIPSGLAAMLTSTGPAIVTFFSMRARAAPAGSGAVARARARTGRGGVARAPRRSSSARTSR